MENLIEKFKKNQTLSKLQGMKNNGLEIFELKSGKFIKINEFKLPLKGNFINLYNEKLMPIGVGIY